jgi:hypothetical protein
MNLYLDLHKAVQIPTTGTDAVSGPHAARKYNESFNRVNSGVMGGDASPDRPEVGRKWRKPDQEDSLDEDLEEDRKKDSELAAERGIIPSKEKDDSSSTTKKALDILKSFSGELSTQLAAYTPNEREIEYLTAVRGYDYTDVVKGYVQISGRERSKFNDWLHERLKTSIDRLVSR